MIVVFMVLTAPGEGFETILDTMISFQAITKAATALIQSAAQEMKDRAAQERSGVLSSSKIDLSLYRDPIVARNTAVSDFRLTDLMHGDQPASLYIIVPPSDIDRLRPLLRILWNLLLRRLMQTFAAALADHRPARQTRQRDPDRRLTPLDTLDPFHPVAFPATEPCRSIPLGQRYPLAVCLVWRLPVCQKGPLPARIERSSRKSAMNQIFPSTDCA